MFNRIKMRLARHVSIILLHSFTIIIEHIPCQISCSNSQYFLLRKTKIYVNELRAETNKMQFQRRKWIAIIN